MTTLYLKLGLALGSSALFGAVYLLRQRLERMAARPADRVLFGLFIACRLVPFLTVYLVLNQEPRSDVPHFYEAARMALQGKIVYRDFWSPYGPLFAYVTALPLLVWHSAKAVVLLMVLVEGLAWWLTYRFFRQQRGPETQAIAALYLLLPAPLAFCVLGGQEDSWMWAVGAVSLFVWQQKPDAYRLGLLMAVMLIVTKALALLIIVPLLCWVNRPVRYVAGLLTIGIPGLILLYALTGTGVLTALMFADMVFAPNVWTLLAPVIGDFMPYAKTLSIVGLLLVVTVACLTAWTLRRQRVSYDQSLPLIWVICFGAMMVVHKSSFANYGFIYMLPLVFGVITWSDRRQVLILMLVNALLTVQPTYWWGLGTPLYTNWSMLGQPAYLLEYGLEAGIIAGVCYWVWLAYRAVRPAAVPLNKQQHVTA